VNEIEKLLSKAMKLEGTKISLQEGLNYWIECVNEELWKNDRFNKRYMRRAFVPVFIETALVLLSLDYSKEETLEIVSKIVNNEVGRWKD
jgi:hypothetical protein